MQPPVWTIQDITLGGVGAHPLGTDSIDVAQGLPDHQNSRALPKNRITVCLH